MKNFNWTRYLITVLVAYIVFEIMEFLIHGVFLMDTYEELEGTGLFREDMESHMWIVYVTAIVFIILFVYLFHYFANAYKTGWMAGLYFGLVVGVMMNFMGMLNQFAVYPVPESLAWNWVIFSILQVAIVGIVAGLLYKPKATE